MMEVSRIHKARIQQSTYPAEETWGWVPGRTAGRKTESAGSRTEGIHQQTEGSRQQTGRNQRRWEGGPYPTVMMVSIDSSDVNVYNNQLTLHFNGRPLTW